MITRWAWTIPVVCGVLLVGAARGQGPGYPPNYSGAPPMAAGAQGYDPRLQGFDPRMGYDPRMANYAPPEAMAAAQGGVMPASYQGPMGGPGDYAGAGGPGMGPPGGPGPDGMGYGPGGPQGQDCGPGGGLFDDAIANGVSGNGPFRELIRFLAPYPEGGRNALRWFDVSADAMYMMRTSTWNRVALTSGSPAIGVPPNVEPADILLSTTNAGAQASMGFRFMFNIHIGPAQSTEFVYFGPFDFISRAEVIDPTNNLFSRFSQFGRVNPPFGFAETDQAFFHGITYESKLDNFEWNFRQRFQSINGRFQGSWLAGARFVKVDESLRFHSEANLTGNNLSIFEDIQRTSNSLTGGQIGGDLWITPISGLRMGLEGKAGVFGNYATSRADLTSTTFVPPLDPSFRDERHRNGVSFVGDTIFQTTYRLNYHWTLRGGYNFMYVTGLALAPNNFNAQPPPQFTPAQNPRESFIQLGANNIYHGANLGAEYLW